MFHRNCRSDFIVTEEQFQTEYINSIDPKRTLGSVHLRGHRLDLDLQFRSGVPRPPAEIALALASYQEIGSTMAPS